jgi:hypothetical protein
MSGLIAPAAGALTASSRYELVNGCYGLRSESRGRLVATDTGPFRMQATDLGRYLLYGRKRDFLTGSGDRVEAAPRPTAAADWRVEVDGDAFKLTLPSANRALATSSAGDLVLVATPQAGRFTFQRAEGCPAFPEIDVNATGTPGGNPIGYGEVSGFLEAHMHWMAFEFLGGDAHCGRPWHAWGVEQALVDCPDHYPNGSTAVLENALAGGGRPTHDPVGWPTFKDWPAYNSLTHEQSYHRWVERAWRGGLRLYVNLLVDNGVLCEVYPYKRNGCDEMATIRLEARRLDELQDYVDAQNGGPGKGWLRIVRDPFEARRVINQGKMAVVLGIETSRLFNCRISNDVPSCDRAMVDRELDAVYRMGVRQMELLNKFDNAFSGVAGDSGAFGVVVNNGNRYETGRYWQLGSCANSQDTDNPQFGYPRDALLANGLAALLPPGSAPVYPDPPHCNTRGLTDLGDHLIRGMMRKGMIFDPDHMSVLARQQALNLIESRNYPGVVSSHSWSTKDAYRRIGALGGVLAPASKGTVGFLRDWREYRTYRSPKHYWGMGYGADQNGFANQGPPRANNQANPVKYPFKSFDGKVTFDRQRSGQRVYDVNRDGVAHYGMYPDWIEDLRIIGGPEIVKDMARGAEAYLQMWERAVGVPPVECRNLRGIFTGGGANRLRLNATTEQALRSGGQPRARGRTWSWCVKAPNADVNPKAKAVAVFTPGERVGLIGSTAPGHKARNVGTGRPARALRGLARRFGTADVMTRRLRGGVRLVWGIRRGRVRYVAVASPEVARTPARLRAYLKLAGLR